ncbi:deubiquitinating protein VCIP135 [Aplysia californica]|uniref:ubiquitinyl hydrolase 1 n=1 Tax=Aplysia californica TaxID=6500 RepID=A0ABM0JRE6_APLCA|nr:deubiquitinating protein VCIP135 [Aplysia californica]
MEEPNGYPLALLLNLELGTLEVLDSLLFNTRRTPLVDGTNTSPPCPPREVFKVNGLSNYLCTILSPSLTYYGMDKSSGKAKLLTDMGKAAVFDCGHLCDRAFLIQTDHLHISGYGMDRSGSAHYLQETLSLIKLSNENEERLVPIHADGDGHCLVHAVSRALIGWELFWHPLRVNLKQHLEENLEKYKMQFGDFIDSSEWDLIIEECDPEFVPSGSEPTGLRNIHIFGLANVLRRPIILLDSVEGISSSGDYSGVFLPYFSLPSACMNKDGLLNQPLCIAWSNPGRNHFIPLVGVKGKKCPRLPRHMIQRAWGVPDTAIEEYLHFDQQGFCLVGGEKVLQVGYLQRLVAAMSDIFVQEHRVSPALVADVYQHIFKPKGLIFGISLDLLLDTTVSSVAEEKLYVCLSCHSLALSQALEAQCCTPGGDLYDLALQCHGPLKDGQKYKFPVHDVSATYSAALDRLVPTPPPCFSCGKSDFRLVRADYSVVYRDGDSTLTKSSRSATGYKHFWKGKEYDTIPKRVLVRMDWGGKVVEEFVYWFQDESDPTLDSNVYQMAQDLVHEHFPGEFGSERLVQRVVDQILLQVNMTPAGHATGQSGSGAGASDSPESKMEEDSDHAWSPTRASKAILLGMQRQTVHKEELTRSATEKQVRQNIEDKAWKQHRKLSDRMAAERKSPVHGDGTRKTSERKAGPPSPSKTSPPPGTAQTTLTPDASQTTLTPGPSQTTLTPGPSQTRVSQTTDNVSGSSQAAPVNKRIRLSTADGKNMTLDLPADCTFLQLQSLIASAAHVPPDRQRIRYGFPPRELKVPEGEWQDYKVPVQPGDRIMLDVVTAPSSGAPDTSGNEDRTDSQVVRTVDRSNIHGLPARRDDSSGNSFAEGGMDEVSDRVLMGLMDPLLHSGGDSLDHCLSSLALTAALEHRDMWSYAQRLPHLFSVNGLFYKQVERDMGLEHGKHCTLPLLPGKLFVYNGNDDRLELCLEPYGHFPVENRVESRAQTMLPTCHCGLKTSYKPFSGQGHSLRSSTSSEDRMPTDIPMSPKRHEARRVTTFCDPAIHQESIEEEEEEEEESAPGERKEGSASTSSSSSQPSSHCLPPAELLRSLPLRGLLSTPGSLPQPLLTAPDSGRLVRRGPGYSELSPIPENSSNERADMLHQLVRRMERAVETMGQEAEAISSGRNPPQIRSSFAGLVSGEGEEEGEGVEVKEGEVENNSGTAGTTTSSTTTTPTVPVAATTTLLSSSALSAQATSSPSPSPSSSSKRWEYSASSTYHPHSPVTVTTNSPGLASPSTPRVPHFHDVSASPSATLSPPQSQGSTSPLSHPGPTADSLQVGLGRLATLNHSPSSSSSSSSNPASASPYGNSRTSFSENDTSSRAAQGEGQDGEEMEADANAIAILAGEVASNIAAMDQDIKPFSPTSSNHPEEGKGTSLPIATSTGEDVSEETSASVPRHLSGESTETGVEMMDTVWTESDHQLIGSALPAQTNIEARMSIDLQDRGTTSREEAMREEEEEELEDLFVKEQTPDVAQKSPEEKQEGTSAMDSL